MRAILAITLAVFGGLANACPFCTATGQSLFSEVDQADFIVVGKLTNPVRDPDDILKGTTDLVIERVVKPHSYLTGRTTLRLPRYIPVDEKDDTLQLVFCSLYLRPIDMAQAALVSTAHLAKSDSWKLDPYRGEKVASQGKLPAYLQGAIALRTKPVPERLLYFFDYLDSSDPLVSQDAYAEFASADYEDVRVTAVKLPAEKILKWLSDKGTPANRFGLYGLLLGHCGKLEHAEVLKKLLAAPDRATATGQDGLLVATILLDPKGGAEILNEMLKKEKPSFTQLYTVLRVLRFLKENRADLLPKAQVLESFALLVARPEIADMPVDDLRRWEEWSLTPTVLRYAREKSHTSVPIVRRAFLRYAIAAPKEFPEAAEFVEAMRKSDPAAVTIAEEVVVEDRRRRKEGKLPTGKSPNGKVGK